MINNLAIIGSGPAGYTAGLYAARANLEPVLFEGLESGGQLMLTTDVENYPGFKDGILGPELMKEFKAQAEKFGTKIYPLTVTSINESNQGFELVTSKDTYLTKSIIVSSGASAKWLGVEGENRLQGYGVSACATCDGFFFKDKIVTVVGGGDSAMEEALFLTKFAEKVYIVHRRDSFRASAIMQKRVEDHTKIEVLWNKEVGEIRGKDSVSSVELKDTINSEILELDTDAVFVAIGHTPNVGFLDGLLELDQNGYIKTGFTTPTSTSKEGVFAAGDVADSIYRQAITAAGTGCQAAMDVERWLES
jgi:thioredoxin reductase (NADPH)